MSGCAWVTLATNDSYALGALVLAHSLRKSNTIHKLVVLITPALSPAMRKQLESVFDLVKLVNVLDSKDEAHLALMKRPELGITFTKIHCWRLTEFEKCVFLDADTLVVRNCDELFEREEFSAAPDVSWPDCFNSGVFVYKPSDTTFHKLLEFAAEKGSFDGGDQGLLNQFFSDWATEDIKKHLPFVYNLTTVAAYSYIPAFKQYGSETRIVHFIGTGKPWLQQFDPATKTITPTSGSEHLCPLLQEWWNLFCEKVHPDLDKSLEIANGMSHLPVEVCSNSIDVECNDEPEPPCLLEPQTPYREKNDFRQINLPYQPFDVKDSSGELLNIKFFTASVVPPSSPSSPSPPTTTTTNLEEQQRQPREWEKEEEKNYSEDDKKETGDVESDGNCRNENEFQKPDGGGSNEDVETERGEEEKPQEETPKGPFDYGSFFPDETCIDNYLQQNVITYQPFGTPHHDYGERNGSKNNSSYEGDNNDSNSSFDQGSENIPPPLPRFLTIPEDDQRQRGNEEKCPSEERQFKQVEETVVHHAPEQPKDEDKPKFDVSREERSERVETLVEKPELHKSKSMGHLVGYANTPDGSPRGSIWKSQSSVNTDPNKKYSMPKLKPILPKQNSKSVLPSIPKVTLYTEFLMSSEYKVPEDLPKDKVGFVESHLRDSKVSHLKRSKSDADINGKFGPLPYSHTTEVEKTRIPKQKILFRRLDNDSGLYDLSQCKRQQGNKPKPKESGEKKENNVLPALKPLIPSKDKKSVKKRKSNELPLSPGDGDREKRAKQERKRGKERKKKSKPTSVSSKKNVNSNTDSVEDILKRLHGFSKDYQHYFESIRFKSAGDKTESRTEVETRDETAKRETYGNANVQETPRSEENFQISERISSVTRTGSEYNSELENSEKTEGNRKMNSNAEFKKFRSYLKDQTETTLKGLLDIPKMMSELDGNNEEPKIRKSGATIGMSSLDVVKAFGSYKPNEGITEPEVSVSKSIKSDSRSEDIGKEGNEVDSKISGRVDSLKEGSVTTTDDDVSENKKQDISGSQITSTQTSVPTVKANAQPEYEAKSKSTGPEEVEGVKEFSSSKDSNPDTSIDGEVLNGDNFKQGEGRIVRAASNVVETSKTQNESKVTVVNGGSDKVHDYNLKVRDCKKLDAIKYKKPEPLCVPDFDTPRSSRVCLVAPNVTQKHSQVTEIVEEIIAKAVSSAVLKEASVSREKSSPSPSTTLPVKPSEVSRKFNKDPDRKSKSSPGSSKVRSPRSSMANGTKSSIVEKQNGVVNHHVFADYSPDETASFSHKKMAVKNRPPIYPPAKFSVSPSNNGSDCSNNGQDTSATLEDRRRASGIAGALAQLNLESGVEGTKQQTDGNSTAYPEYLRRQNWETGNMDYMGRDSFDNIWSKICQTLEGKMLEISGESSEPPSVDNSVPTKIIPAQDVSKQLGSEGQSVSQVVGSEPKTTETTTATELKNGGNVPVLENPEYMDTLPGSETSQGPAEDDEIIFTKPENRQTQLTNIVEEEEADTGSKVQSDVVSQPESVKLSDILKPEQSIAGEDMKNWALVKRPGADKLQVVEVPKKPETKADGASETAKSKLSKVASLREAGKPQEDVMKEAIPLPDVPVRGDQEPSTPTPIPASTPAPQSAEPKDKEPLPEEQTTETQSGLESSNGKQKKGVFSKILEIVGVTPKGKKETEAEVSKSVFYDVEGAAVSKGQASKPAGDEKPMPETKESTETKDQVPVGAPPIAETAKEAKPEETVPTTDVKPQEDKKSGGSVVESQVLPQGPSSGEVKEVNKSEISEKKTEEPKPETASIQPQQPKPEVASTQPQEPDTAQKGAAVPKPARNSSTPLEKKPEEQKPVDPTVPSQPLGLTVDPSKKPEIILTMPTPPVVPDVPKVSGDSILGPAQPVIPEEKEKEGEESKSSGKGKVMSEMDEILEKAKSEVESRLHEVENKSGEKEEKPSEEGDENVKDLINTMKLIVGDDQKVEETSQSEDQKGGESSEPAAAGATTTTEGKSGAVKQPGKQVQGKKSQKPQQKKKEEVEELKVTSEEERKKHKAQGASSKLSDQILKAIPPPRRKAISDSKAETSSSTGAIPKTPLEAAAAAVSEAGQSKDIVTDKPAEGPSESKPSKPSSIPVPPPRNKPKPAQPTSQKGKTKK